MENPGNQIGRESTAWRDQDADEREREMDVGDDDMDEEDLAARHQEGIEMLKWVDSF